MAALILQSGPCTASRPRHERTASVAFEGKFWSMTESKRLQKIERAKPKRERKHHDRANPGDAEFIGIGCSAWSCPAARPATQQGDRLYRCRAGCARIARFSPRAYPFDGRAGRTCLDQPAQSSERSGKIHRPQFAA